MKTANRISLSLSLLCLLCLPSCQKEGPGNYSWQKGGDYDILKNLGVDLTDLKVFSEFGYLNEDNRMKKMGSAISGVQDGRNVLYLVLQDLEDQSYSLDGKIDMGKAEEHESINVKWAYGEQRTIYFRGIEITSCYRYDGVTYFALSDYYSEPTVEGQVNVIGEIATQNLNPRLAIAKNGVASIFPIEEIYDDNLNVPGPDGGIIYNGIYYSPSGEILNKVPNEEKYHFFNYDVFFEPAIEEWHILSGGKFFGIRLTSDICSNSFERQTVRFFSFDQPNLQWNETTWVYALREALKAAGANWEGNERIEAIKNVNSTSSVFTYSISGTKYSGDKFNYQITFDTEQCSITANVK